MARMDAALNARAAVVDALDLGAALSVPFVREHIDHAIAYFEPYDDGSSEPQHPEILRDLIAWRDANGFAAVDEVEACLNGELR